MNTTEHEKLEQIIHTDSVDYVSDLIEQIKKLSFYFKKISADCPSNYLASMIGEKVFSLFFNCVF